MLVLAGTLILSGCSSNSTSEQPNTGGAAGTDAASGGGGASDGGQSGGSGGSALGGSGGAGTGGAGTGGTGGAGGSSCGTINGGGTGGAVGDPAPCLGAGSIVVFDGQTGDYIHPTDATITQGYWSSVKYLLTDVELTINPTDPTQGTNWTFVFSSKQLGEPLAIKTYPNAMRASFATPGHPGLEVSGDGKGCNTLSGAFQVHELVLADSPTGCALQSFTATFEQSCETTMPALKGCIRYVRP